MLWNQSKLASPVRHIWVFRFNQCGHPDDLLVESRSPTPILAQIGRTPY